MPYDYLSEKYLTPIEYMDPEPRISFLLLSTSIYYYYLLFSNILFFLQRIRSF